MNSPLPEGTRLQQQEPTVVQIDPKCLHSALKDFFEPLRTNDSRTDFFAVYRRESEEFDRDYARKYNEDLNTSLIFAGLFSAVSSAFIINLQSKLEPDPNEMIATYMQILIHAVNGSLFPDANPNPVTWTGPPPEIVTVQSLLYASLATSFFSAFLAMLGKQWVNRYLRNHGSSAADKSRDRQRKLDGSERWHFRIVIESLPVMLQLALLLLGCAQSLYLWTISRTVAEVLIAITLFGFTSYVFLTLAATLYYNCPYQTPPSIIARTILRYLMRNNATFARLLRSPITSFPSIKSPGQILGRIRPGVRSVLRSFGCVPAIGEDAEHIPLALVTTPPPRVFEDIPIDWEACKADARCISWILGSTTDTDAIFSTVRFAADMIWYPEIAGALSPHVLAGLFFDCLLDGRVMPGKSEHASSIGMALASVLSVRLSMEPEDKNLEKLRYRLMSQVLCERSSKPKFLLVVNVIKVVASTPTQGELCIAPELFGSLPDRLSAAHKLWLSRVFLQTIWRWRCAQGPAGFPSVPTVKAMCKTFAADGDQMPDILKTNLFLILAISLGLQTDIRDLYAPNNNDTLKKAIGAFHKNLRQHITKGKGEDHSLISVLSTLIHLDPFQAMGSGKLGFSWIEEILKSEYQEELREQMASEVVLSLGRHFFHTNQAYSITLEPAWIPPLLGYLSLNEKLRSTGLPGITSLCILAANQGPADFGPMILPILTSSLLSTHHLQSRSLALEVFVRFVSGWFSPQMEKVPSKNLERLVQAVGDPLELLDLRPHDGKLVHLPYYNPTMAAAVLIEFASLDLWRDHLRYSNFTSFEEMVSTWNGKKTALECMANYQFPEFLSTAAKIVKAIRRLEELQCFNTVEVAIMLAWTVGVIDPADHDGWELIECNTFWFYQTHGIERLATLKRHVAERPGVEDFAGLPTLKPQPEIESRHRTHWYLSQACRLRKLYRLFGYDPTTWKEAVGIEEVVSAV